MASDGKEYAMFMWWKQAAAPVPRYQAIRGAHWTARPLTRLQWRLLRRCESAVTLADLVEGTDVPVSEVSEALKFLCKHALVKVVVPERQRLFP
jgi:hypothetical protein